MNRRSIIVAAAIVLLGIGGWALQGHVRAALLQPTKSDLSYGVASQAQKLDIYLPKTGSGPFPVVVYIHGGAFQFGDKREPFEGFATGIEALNARGIAVASINYRMVGEAKFPAAVQDARSAVRWLRENAVSQRIAADRISVWGKSAGAYLAMMVGVGDQSPQFDDPAIAPGVSSRVASVVAMYGPTDFLKMDSQILASACDADTASHNAADSPESQFLGRPITTIGNTVKAASPLTYVRRDAPPMLLQAGKDDCTVPAAQSVTMDVALKAAGARSRLELFDGADHADSAFETTTNHTKIVAFFAQNFGML